VALAEGHSSLGSMGIVAGAIDFNRTNDGGTLDEDMGFAVFDSDSSQAKRKRGGLFIAEGGEPDFEFTPQEIKMDMTVTVKFKAE